MNHRAPPSCLTILFLLLPAIGYACLWDSDTLQMEKKRFPGVFDLITGKFVRHSSDFYEWRAADRKGKLEKSPGDPAMIDDLAVAYDKLGRQADGIALLEACLAKYPKRYETVANLGTLYLHSGDFKRGQELIARAIEINPNAHFGREKYQLWLAEYVAQSELKSAGVLSSKINGNLRGFAEFVLKKTRGPEIAERAGSSGRPEDRQMIVQELRPAIQGMLGIMHFGNYKSPVVLEALGDLLQTGWQDDNASQLAAYAYLRAALETEGMAQQAFRAFAKRALTGHQEYESDQSFQKFEEQFREEIERADEWFSQIATQESDWIAKGVNVEREFKKQYYDTLESTLATAKEAAELELPTPTVFEQIYWPIASPILGTIVLLSGGSWLYLRRRLSRSSVRKS